MYKKIFSVIIIILLFTITPVFVFADNLPQHIGDLDCDGYTTAYDARTVIRYAQGLAAYDDMEFLAADVDSDGMITAADARIILRASSKIDKYENFASVRTFLDCERSENVSVKMTVSGNAYPVVGDTVVVTVSAENISGLECGNIFFNYDSEIFEFESIKCTSHEFATSVYDSIYDNELSFGFVFSTQCSSTDADIAKITFTAKKVGECELKCSVGTWVGTDVPTDSNIVVDVHEHDYSEVILPPTCIEEGYTTYTCSICNDSFINDYISALGHTMNEGGVTNPTCAEQGYTTYTCLVCGYSNKDDYTEKLPHTFIDKNMYCDICGEYALMYIHDKDGVLILSCDKSISGDIIIPDKIENRPVIRLGTDSFKGCKKITSVIIPNSVTSIEDNTFGDCENLEMVTIGKNVTTIDAYAFSRCKNIVYFVVDEHNKNYSNDEYGVLFNKDKTKLIKYPTANILNKYSIPESVREVDYFAFSDTLNLKVIYVSYNVVDLGNNVALTRCKNLEKIIVDENNKVFESDNNGVLYYKGRTTLLQYPAGRTNTEYVIPINVDFVSAYAFKNCHNLKSITIPYINEQFFSNKAIGYIETADYNLKKIDGFIIKGFKDSLAEKYANENGFEFIAIDEYPTDVIMSNKLDVLDNGSITISENIAIVVPEMTVENIIKSVKNEKIAILSAGGKKLADNALAGTGTKVQILDNNGKVLTEYTVLVKSDVNGDAKITAADARVALRASAKLENLKDVFVTAADNNGDKKITAADARKILRKSAKLE